jgi:MerR family transcriptional regulator/heat shock protein HspR
MLAELFDIATTGDENRRVPMARSQSAAGQDSERRSQQTHGRGRITGVYVISVAARLADMHPQTLRKYDKEGLVSPQRSEGSRRLYSDSDVERLRVIRRLADELGLNLNGVSLVLDLVRSLTDIVSLLESSPEVSDTRTARVAADELRQILSYVGAD